MKKKLIALLLAGAMLMTACSTSGGEDKSKDGGSSSGSDELVVSHYFLEEERESDTVADSYLAMVEKWQEENPDITITQQTMSQSDYSTKIQAQAAVNELPDVFMVKGSWINNFAENDTMAPMNEYLDADENTDKFREGVFDAATREGNIYGMPNQLSITSIVYYNEELWKSIGYDEFPDDLAEVKTAAAKFNEQGISTIALGNSEKWPAESCILSTLGDRYTGAEWTNSIIDGDGQAKFTDESFVKALAEFQSLAQADVFNPDFNTITETQAVEYYAQGKAATVISGHWGVASVSAFADEEILGNTKVAILPAQGGGQADSISGGSGWYFAVNKNLTGEKLDQAMDFVFSTTGYDMCVYGAEEHGIIGAAIVDVDQSKFPQLTQDFTALMDGMTFTPVYDLLMDGAVIEVMNTGLQDLLNDSVTPEDLAAQIQAEQDKVAK